ncbi:MAG: hypothetical protein WDN72_11020 [Alphaproteobacteria bacterium]
MISWIPLALAACGFHPLQSRAYQDSLAVGFSAVRIEVDEYRFGKPRENHSHLSQLLETEIREGINPRFAPAEKLYVLKIAVTERDVPLFINPDGTSSRGEVEYDSNYSLTRITDHKLVQAGSISRTSSYNTAQNQDYASYVSEEDAKTRGIEQLAEGYRLRLANLLPRLNGMAAPTPTAAQPPLAPADHAPLPPPGVNQLNGFEYETP